MNLVCVDPAHVHKLWHQARPLIFAATERCGDVAITEIETGLGTGHALLWLATEDGEIYAAAITQLTITHGIKRCEVVACGGREMPRWLQTIEGIEAYAKAEGCASVRVTGRHGWARALRDYEEPWVILEKRLDH